MYFVGSMFSPSVFVPSSKGPPSVHAGIFGVVQEPRREVLRGSSIGNPGILLAPPFLFRMELETRID